ncbi:PH domain-containing protein [Clostridium sp.]|uniref:PH domain-containing protein n=1 Tax=Clostridium sp. TaxID=1506 RepID=UPI002E766571|nr:PH domain-containing protein [Clostridium sp.]MEE0567203.1 PH domain-containing protein [Clostridium sp.]
MNLVMLITSLVIIVVYYWQAQSAVKPNKNIILGVTIPPLELSNIEITDVTKEFMYNMKILSVLSIVIYFPLMFMKTVWLLIGWFLWFSLFCYIYYKLICKFNGKLKEVKRKNDWLLPNKHILNIDTELTKAKSKMPISKWWFLIALFIGISPFILNIINKNEYFSTAVICTGSSIVGTLILFIIYMIYVKGRTIVYCDESKINIACNKVYKRTWSIIYTSLAILQSITNTTLYVFMLLPRVNENVFLIAITLPVIIVVLGIVYGNRRIINMQNQLISVAENPIYVDSDEYWINGMSYKNPYDNRVVVEPRIGTKPVYNLATKKGRLITYGTNIFIAVSVLTIILMMLYFELYGFNMKIIDNSVKINAPLYGIEFNVEDIEKVEIVDKLKVKLRINGIGMDEYSVGNFNVEGYGKCKLYIYNDVKPYILIKSNDEIIFINGENEEETLRYYNEFIAVINKKY